LENQEMTKYLFGILLLSFVSIALQARADKLDGNGILRNDDGSIRFINQGQFMLNGPVNGFMAFIRTLCPDGYHLPTLRETITDAEKFGEKVFPATGSGRLVQNPDGTADQIDYSNKTYKAPQNDLGKYIYLTSSSWMPEGYVDMDAAMGFDGRNGFADPADGFGFLEVVRCFPNPR
jgi:hypothetical protein